MFTNLGKCCQGGLGKEVKEKGEKGEKEKGEKGEKEKEKGDFWAFWEYPLGFDKFVEVYKNWPCERAMIKKVNAIV